MKSVGRLVLSLTVALTALVLTPGTAHAYEVRVEVLGAGIVDETTPANKLYCVAPYSSNPYACTAGSPTGEYSWGWTVVYEASARPGYAFSHWEDPDGGRVICDEAGLALTNTSTTCTFETFGNLSVRAVFVDQTAPSVPVLTATPGTTTNDTSPTFQVGATGDPTFKHHEWRLNSGSWTSTTSSTISMATTSNGPHTFEVRARDYAGNVSDSRTYTWTVDTVPPTVAMTSPTDGMVTNAGHISVSGTAGEGATQVSIFRNAALLATVSPVNGSWTYVHGGPEPGVHSYWATARDAAGNTSAQTPARVVEIDRIPPAVAVSAPADPSFDGDGDVTLTGTAEPGAVVKVLDEGAEVVSVVAGEDQGWSATLYGLADGDHVLSVNATDAAGNNSAPVERTVTVDTRAPLAAVVAPSSGATKVGRRSNVTAAFSEPVRSATVKSTTVHLVRKGTTKKVGATVSYDPATQQVTLDPRDRLRPRTVYVATVTRGVQDLAGHRLLSTLRWSFKTAR